MLVVIDGRDPNAVPTTMSREQFEGLLPIQLEAFSPEWKSKARVFIYQIGDKFVPALYHNRSLTLCAEYKTKRGADNWVARNYPHTAKINEKEAK